jgi:hypothetical protein
MARDSPSRWHDTPVYVSRENGARTYRILSRIPLSRRIQGDKGLRVEDRLEAIAKELAEIMISPSFPQSPRFVRLKGLWKGLRVSRHAVARAKRSLFRNASK